MGERGRGLGSTRVTTPFLLPGVSFAVGTEGGRQAVTGINEGVGVCLRFPLLDNALLLCECSPTPPLSPVFHPTRTPCDSVNPPCIPYLGTYLTDLTFIDDGNPDEVDGMINFFKWSLTAGVIEDLSRFQQISYR